MHWRCLSVSFFAVADVRPTRERQEAVAVNVKHQIDMIQRGEEIMQSVVAREPMRAKSCVRVLIPQSGSSVDAKSVLRNVPDTIGLNRLERRCGHFVGVSTEITNFSLVGCVFFSCFNAQRTTANTRRCSCCMSACLYAFSTISAQLCTDLCTCNRPTIMTVFDDHGGPSSLAHRSSNRARHLSECC